MASYAELKAQAEKLLQKAEALRSQEISETIASIKKAIAAYGLTAEDLGLSKKSGRKPAKASGRGTKATKKATKAKPGRPPGRPAQASKKSSKDGRSVVLPKYRNPASGQTWTGRGKKPKWLEAALANGKKISDFKI
jgi:DNA-binding protein H-NS